MYCYKKFTVSHTLFSTLAFRSSIRICFQNSNQGHDSWRTVEWRPGSEMCTFLCKHGPNKHTHHTTTFMMSRPWRQGGHLKSSKFMGSVVSIPRSLMWPITPCCSGVQPAFLELSPSWDSLSRGLSRGLGTVPIPSSWTSRSGCLVPTSQPLSRVLCSRSAPSQPSSSNNAVLGQKGKHCRCPVAGQTSS